MKFWKTIVLTGDHAGPGTLGHDQEIDLAPAGPSLGDQDVFSDDLRDRRGNVAGKPLTLPSTLATR